MSRLYILNNKNKMQFKVLIQGITPYMQHRMDDIKLATWEKQRHHIIERKDVNKEDAVRAEYHCYRDKETDKCYIPADHIRGSLIDAGGYLKSKVGVKTKSMKSIVAAMFIVIPEKIFLPDYNEIDKRSGVNFHVKGRVITIRPKWTEWKALFTLDIGEDTLTQETIVELLRIAGSYVGIGSFRPSHNGYFGRFRLIKINQS